MLADAGVPVIVHCGSGPVPGPHTGPEPFAAVLARHPRLIAVIAHLGAPEYGQFLDLAVAYPGVRLDTTMVFTDFMEKIAPFPAALVPRLAALADRALLGSDFPNIPHPYICQLRALARLGLGAEWLRGVPRQRGQAAETVMPLSRSWYPPAYIAGPDITITEALARRFRR